MKKFFKEFKEFIMRGNVMDLAIAVIIGGAFQNIIKSLTTDIISPLLGIFLKQDFSTLVWNINGAEVKYGAFITGVINFLIMAFVIFLLIKAIAKVKSFGKKKAEEEAAPTTKKCPFCCSEIAIEATRCPNCTSELK